MLTNILLNTVAVPFMAGLVLAFLALVAKTRGSLLVAIFFPLVIATLYCLLEGLPSLPPVGGKQKLPLLLPLVSCLMLILGILAARASLAALTIFSFIATTLGVIWLGQNILLSNPTKFVTAEGTVILFFIGTYTAITGQDGGSRLKRALFIPAVLSVSFGMAILSALGAFLGMAQANGALAAALGAIALVSLILQFRTHKALSDLTAMPLLAIAATTALFMAFSILFAPKIAPAAAFLTASSTLVPYILDKSARQKSQATSLPLRFIVGSLLTSIPPLLAIGLVIISSL